MEYLYAFLVCGFICGIGELVIELTSLTPGHLNAILVVTGSILSFLGIYDLLLKYAGAGASVPITNFGHLLFKGAYQGYLDDGMTGLLNGILSTSSGGLSVAIIMGFVVSIFAHPKN